MDSTANRRSSRLDQIPVLYVRGTHREVGFAIGRQFRYMVEDALEKSEFFNELVLPGYETDRGKEIYEKSLKICNITFPNYVEELQGIADGAKIPFYKLFLLHLEFFMLSPEEALKTEGVTGCSSIICNFEDEMIMGHTEDAGPELLNNVFIVSAEILNDEGKRVEKFTSLTYAGCLPGYTMGFNEYGVVHTVNTLYPTNTCHGKTPRAFIARALHRASNLNEVMNILLDKGFGISDGFSLNIHFSKEEGPSKTYNIEVSPNPDSNESIINILTVPEGKSEVHCNKFLRINVPQLPKASKSSNHRHDAIAKHPNPQPGSIEQTVKEILSDQSDPVYSVFRYGDKEPDLITTVVVGIFEISERRWSLYTKPPTESKPVAVLPLDF